MGVQVSLVGPPNAGKSSLLNALSNREAAIVTNVPGTTRDIISVPLNVHGYATRIRARLATVKMMGWISWSK